MVGSSKYLVADQGITYTQSYNVSTNLYSFTTRTFRKVPFFVQVNGVEHSLNTVSAVRLDNGRGRARARTSTIGHFGIAEQPRAV